jgi:hypothetical protein
MVQYFPTFYIPAALGLLIGEKLKLSPLHTVFLARITMLLSFLAMGATALALTRFGGALLFATLTLPTTINLAASVNQDGQFIAASVLAACAKTPYAPMLLLCLPALFGPGFSRRASVVLLASMLPATWLFYMLRTSFSPWPRPPYHPGPLWPGSRDIWLNSVAPHYNISVLLAHPAQILLLPLTSFWATWPATWPDILAVLGWQWIPISAWEYVGLAVALAAAALGTMARGAASWRRRMLASRF